jgi:hypothetical protein
MKFAESRFYKVSKTRIFGKRSFFSMKRKGVRKFFLSVCFSLDGLSFEHLPVPSSDSQGEKIKK